jgi:hypothetical protein
MDWFNYMRDERMRKITKLSIKRKGKEIAKILESESNA